jgi:hypothetical protein
MSQVRFQPRLGRYLAAAAENVVSIFDVETGTCLHSLQVCLLFICTLFALLRDLNAPIVLQACEIGDVKEITMHKVARSLLHSGLTVLYSMFCPIHRCC